MRRRAVLAVLALASAANAAPSANEVAAHHLVELARIDERASAWQQAIAKLERAASMRETASLRYHLGYCREQMGHLVEAGREYDRAAELVGADDAGDFGLVLGQHQTELRARVPTVALTLPPDVRSAELRIDGAPVAGGGFGRPLPLDPGPHDVLVTAEGRRPFRVRLTLAERQAAAYALELPPVVQTQVGDIVVAPRSEAGRRSNVGRTVVVLSEAAVTAAGVGLVIGGRLKAGDADSRIEADQADLQGASSCTQPSPATAAACGDLTRAFSDRSTGNTMTAIGTGVALVGAVSFVATWLLWSTADTQTHVIERAAVAPTPGGLVLTGTFQ